MSYIRENKTVYLSFGRKADLSRLFFNLLEKTYWAEQELLGVIAEMRSVSSSSELWDFFDLHHRQTLDHIRRLEDIFALWGRPPGGKTCYAMEGLLREIRQLIHAPYDDNIRDIGLLLASRKIDYYEIIAYNTLNRLTAGIDFARYNSQEDDAVRNLLSMYRFVN
ncbi:DUF892 family protein [Compostibacter hankyongensis]|uniref:DUF892 family protein n=1 Tax=Compostibacter hankyongensis TaxID=1007089 RepID=A0ABP8FPL4_9BACT